MNWGKKLVLGMALFMSFIIFLSTKMILSNNDELIDKNYYEDGLNYDKEYNAHKQALKDSVIPEFDVNATGLSINFPTKVSYNISSKFLANAGKDRNYKGIADKTILIPSSEMDKGEWVLNLRYSATGKEYQIKKEIIMP